MCKRLYNKSFFIALMLATFAVVSGVHAESWIPIKSGEITIFIPQYNFKATKVAPGQYTLSWNNQSGATSYKIDRLAADPETSATADEIQTIWQTVAEITNNSFNITHDLATYDLAGHQNYRLLSCQSTICTEIGALSYFVSNTELQEAIPQDFTLTTETSASAKVSGLSAQNDNPYEYGYGYSYVTGHDDPSGETVANSKISSKNRLNSNNIITPSANVMSANNVRLAWKPVRGATHYVVSKIPDRGESPTFNRLYGEVNNLHAKSTSFNLGLSAGTYKFVVYACSGYGFCGLASASVEKVVTITPDPTRQPKNLIIPEFATSGVAFHLRWGTPDVTAGLTHYEVAGELGGIIGTIPANQALEFERNNSTSSQLASGRQYCYKVRAVYSTGAGQYVIPDAPNPHCVKVGGEPILPAPANITLVGEVGDADIHSGKVIYTTRVPTLLTGYSISWGAVAGASYYQLDHEIIPGSGNWSPVYVGTIPHHQQHFSTNAFEAYRVSACKSNGYCGNYQRLYFDSVAGISSSTLAKYKKPACLNVPSSIGPGETIPVSWCAPQTTGVASYEMTDISGTLIHGGPPSFFNKTLQGLVASPQPAPALGNQYCYTVKAYFPNDASSYSTSQKCGTVKNKAAMPVISPASGDIYHITEIGFSSSSTSAEFEYAVVPVAGSCDTVAVYQWKRYTGSLTLADSARICARATRSDLIDSDIAINNFTVVNLPPQITSSPAQSTIVSGSEFSYQVTIEDTDSSTFTYELTSAPAGMTVNTSGLVSWTPIDADIGDNFVTLKVTDLKDADQQTFALTVIERPPISAVDIANLNAQDGSFRVNWLLNSAATSVDVVEEFNGVWGSPLTVNNATYKDYSAKPAGRYRYKVGDKVSAAFTLSTFTPSAAVSSSVDLTGLSGDVGFTAGQFRVSESGAATYSVPLNLPAGVAGVKPQVSLNYSSQGGDSNMGRGWSLAVGGAISRCPANMFHNGDISGIGYDDTDLFCLNSQQLVLKAGSYGAAGSTYYTAIDGFSIITAHGNAADSGPNYFTVETKSGDTYYYGQTTDANDAGDAFVEPNTVGGNNAMAKYWALKKLVDVSGNAILYHYNEETATGVHALTSLEYGKNEGVSTSRYFNKVTFNYIDDPKPRVGYSGGSMVVMDQLLDSISITVDDSSYRYYELNYDSSNIIEERTYLESVRECLAQNSHCLSPLSFTWERPPTAGSNFTPFAASTGLTTSSKGRQFARTIDINADGYSDIVYEDDGWYAVYGPSFDNTPQFLSSIGSSDADRSYARTIDYDGDGKQELLVANGNPGGTNGNWTVLSFNNGSFQPVDLGRTAIGLAGAAQIMDIDGDGLQDIMYKSGAQLAMYRNQGNGQFSGAVVLTAFNSGDTELHFDNFSVTNSPSMKNSAAIDGDGDGRTDLLSRMTSANWYCDPETAGNNYEQCTGNGGKWVPERSYGWRLLVSSGTLAAPQLTEFATIDYDGEDLRATDFNGDGLTDVVYHKDSNDTWYYRLSNGKGFGAEHQTTHTSPDDAKHEIFFIDLNSDGRADILKPTSKTSWDILLSRPSTSSEVITWEKRGTLARDVDDSILFGDVDGDGKVDLVTSDNDNGWQVQYADRRGIIDNVITDFTNGWGVSTTVTYETLLNDTVKIAGLSNNVIADTLSPVSAMTVVKKVESDSNINSRVAVDYRYGGMLLHRKGLGSLGFKQLNTTDAQSGVQTNTTYSQEYPYVGMPLTTQQTAAGLVISSATNSLSQIATTSNGGTFPYISSVEDKQYQIGTDGSYHTLARTVTSNSYDGWGNLTGNTVTINDGYTLLHTTTSSNNFGTANSYEQQKGRLLSSTVTKVQGSQPAINRTSTFGYYASGSICDGVTQPQGMLQSSSVNGLTTTTCYNVFGHKARVSKSGKINDGDSSVTTITSSSTFSADGRSVASTTNNLGHTTTLAYNGISATGTVTGLITKTSATDVNGLTVINHIDTWGKTIATESPFSPVKTTQTAYCSSCGTNGKYYVETRQAGTPTKRVVIDSFGREVEARVQHFNNGSYSYSFKDYDNQGRLLKAYLPTTTGNRGYDYTLNSYDNYGRVTRVTQANGNSATVTLAGLVTIKTDPKGNTSTETANLLGQLVSVNDSIGGILTYTYNAYGNMLTASKSSDGTDILQVSNTFNSYGQKTATTDIDKGTWQFRYNDFGKQVWQQSANTDATTTEFDSSGRKNRVSSFDFTQCWIYGTAADANANGKLIETKYFDSKSNKACTATDFNQRSKIAYDSVGRASHTTQTINNLMDPLNGEYHAFSEFDSYGRLHKQHYAGLGLTIRHEYKNGYPYKLINDATGKVYQQISAVNASGQTISATYANGTSEAINYNDQTGLVTGHVLSKSAILHNLNYDYDANNNLSSRSHSFGTLSNNASYSESYSYDGLNRLTGRSVSTTNQGTMPSTYNMSETYAYDAFGNFTSKGADKYYKYNANKRLTGIYDNAGLTGTAQYNFAYDSNGNIVGDGSRNMLYSSFDKPIQINKGQTATSFIYGMGHKRYYRHDKRTTAGVETDTHTAYLGGLEKIYRTKAGNDNDLLEYKVYVGNVVITERTNAANNASTDESYLHKDHLGSPLTITDKSGKVIQQNAYDPWGKVHKLYSDEIAIGGNLQPTTRGFTGHEGLDGLDIIHMNGRIYDANIGRFLQADPHIQAPTNSQSFNRYAYVVNNPLSLTDPSGFFFKKLLKATMKLNGSWFAHKLLNKIPILKGIVSVALNFIPGCQVWCTAVFNAMSTFVATGSLNAAIKTGAISYATGAALQSIGGDSYWGDAGNAQNIAANALVGGVSSSLQGGNFGHGFFAAGVASAFKPLIFDKFGYSPEFKVERIATAAIIGGTTSAISGGKFANGAVTGAFNQMYNGETYAKKIWREVQSFTVSMIENAVWQYDAISQGLSDDFSGTFTEGLINFTGGRPNMSFGEQILVGYGQTSLVFGPFELDKMAASALVAGQMAKTWGGMTLGQWKNIKFAPAPHLSTRAATARLVGATTVVNTIAITAAYEGGNLSGSAIRTGVNRTLRYFGD